MEAVNPSRRGLFGLLAAAPLVPLVAKAGTITVASVTVTNPGMGYTGLPLAFKRVSLPLPGPLVSFDWGDFYKPLQRDVE